MLEIDNCLIILKEVPAEVCENCGEYYLSEFITEQVLQRAEMSIDKGSELEIIR